VALAHIADEPPQAVSPWINGRLFRRSTNVSSASGPTQSAPLWSALSHIPYGVLRPRIRLRVAYGDVPDQQWTGAKLTW